MKLIAAAFAFLLLTGCQKKENEIQTYLRMTIDGVKTECTRDIQASDYVSVAPQQLMDISGSWTNSQLEDGNIEIELYGFNNTPGERQIESPGAVTLMLNHHNGSGGVMTDTYFGQGSDTKINITEVNNKYIKGTFQFLLKMNTGPGTFVTKSISGGEFQIAR